MFVMLWQLIGVFVACELFNSKDLRQKVVKCSWMKFNPLNPELNPVCYLLALLRAHHFLHVSRIRVKLLNF